MPRQLGRFIRDKEKNNCTCSWSKILANKVLMSPYPPGYFGSSTSRFCSISEQNNSKQMEDPILLCCTEWILLILRRKTEHWTPSVPSPNNHLDRAGISVWFLPCFVAERNILPWIRQTLSNQRCLDAVRNVIIFPFTSLAQFIAAHSILLYEAVLEKKELHSLAEIVCAAL